MPSSTSEIRQYDKACLRILVTWILVNKDLVNLFWLSLPSSALLCPKHWKLK